MRFSIQPPPGESAFEQWKDAMKAVARLPMGIPQEFRKKVWLGLSNHYIKDLKIDWEKTVRFAFNERSNPDDDKLGMQIVKDLHRTGCSSYSGQDNEEDRAVLKRVLLAYARWNKRVGYCQGFNVIAALLLEVMDRKEDDALMVMIFLVDHVLPESYFANNLRALSVDMAVFRDLLRFTFPNLAKHLIHLQTATQDHNAGPCYEPPLTNVFTMQWFLTLFATCLPKSIVLRVWDSILLEGSEILLRTALVIWGKLARRIRGVTTADEFYTMMGDISADMIQGHLFNADDFIKTIYSVAPFPFPHMTELREQYTYNIRPFSGTTTSKKGTSSRISKNVLYSDDDDLDDLDDEDIEAITCLPGFVPMQGMKGRDGETGSIADISLLGPGAYSMHPDAPGIEPIYLERMSTDISSLKKQYEKLRQRQSQAHIFISAAASAKQTASPKATILVPKIESPLAMNHLFIGKHSGSRNRLVAQGPKIVSGFNQKNRYPQLESQNKREKRSDSVFSTKSDVTLTGNSSCGTLEELMVSNMSTDDKCLQSPAESPGVDHQSQVDSSGTTFDAVHVPEEQDKVGNGEKSISDESVNGQCIDTPEADTEQVDPLECDTAKSIGDNNKSNVKDVISDVQCLHTEADVDTELFSKISSSSDSVNSLADSFTDLQYSKDKENLKRMDRYSRMKPELHLQIPHRMSSELESEALSNQLNTEMLTKFVYIASKQHNNKTKNARSASSATTPTAFEITQTFKPLTPTRPFKPFPMKQLNSNRAKNGLKLGLYSNSTLQQFESQGKRSQGLFFKVKNVT